MTNRPLLTTLNRVLLAALLILTVVGLFIVPLDGNLPIHWDLYGQPDNYAPAWVALLLPAALALFVISLLAVLRPAGLQKDFEAGRHVIVATVSFTLVLAIVLCGATIALGLGYAIDMPRLVAGLIGAMLLVIGNYLPKTQPNWVAGMRLPWTLRDADNWRITHRWSGRLMMAGGVLALVGAVINPPAVILITLVLLAVLLPVLAGIAISYTLARREAVRRP